MHVLVSLLIPYVCALHKWYPTLRRSPALGAAIRIISDPDTNTVYDISSMGMPQVIPPSNVADKWLLWFQSRGRSLDANLVKGSSGRIFHAVSDDGLTFTMHPDSPVLSPSKESGDWFYFDSEHVGLGDILVPGKVAQSQIAIQDGVFFMYTYGGNGDKVTVGSGEVMGAKLEIGVAISQDGAHWSRIEGDGKYLSIVEAGEINDFDALFCGWPCIVEDGSQFKMYYHTYDAKVKKFVVGTAISSNSIKWKKLGPVFSGGGKGAFDEMGVTRRHVLRSRDMGYKMWYEGISAAGVHSIGIATSTDGITWQRVNDEPIFSKNPDERAFDSGGVGSPKLVYLADKKRWRMYYIGVPAGTQDAYDGNEEAVIGVAESTDEEGLYFERL